MWYIPELVFRTMSYLEHNELLNFRLVYKLSHGYKYFVGYVNTSFSPTKYIQSMTIKKLIITSKLDTSFQFNYFIEFDNVTELEISKCALIRRTVPIQFAIFASRLTKLTYPGNVNDILHSLPHLTYLDNCNFYRHGVVLSGSCQHQHLAVLKNCPTCIDTTLHQLFPNLEVMVYCNNVTDAGLQHTPKLRILKFCQKVTDRGLQFVPDLTKLYICERNYITGKGFIHLRHLTHLIIKNEFVIYNNSVLSKLPNLTYLDYRYGKNCRFSNTGLQSIPNLKWLLCSKTNKENTINITNLGLKYIPHLILLDVGTSKIDMDGILQYLPNLRYLFTDASPLFNPTEFAETYGPIVNTRGINVYGPVPKSDPTTIIQHPGYAEYLDNDRKTYRDRSSYQFFIQHHKRRMGYLDLTTSTPIPLTNFTTHLQNILTMSL